MYVSWLPNAKEEMSNPSMSKCGKNSIKYLSLNVPGSLSSALQTK